MEKLLFDTYKGRNVYKYSLENEALKVEFLDLGAKIQSIFVFGKDICLGFNTVNDYIESKSYAGSTIGRVANRIKNAKFSLDGKEYKLYNNDGENSHHGGKEGFDLKFFEVESKTKNQIAFSYISQDLEEGYPGELNLKVIYTLEEDSLNVEYVATSNKDTIFAPTNHTYFNLNGEGSGKVYKTILYINSTKIAEEDDEFCPNGKLLDVENTMYDFTAKRPILIEKYFDDIKDFGYDNCYIIEDDSEFIAEAIGNEISMTILSNLPCVQFYTANFLNSNNGKTSKYGPFDAFCLEPEFMPNAINLKGVRKPYLNMQEEVSYFITYKFSKIENEEIY